MLRFKTLIFFFFAFFILACSSNSKLLCGDWVIKADNANKSTDLTVFQDGSLKFRQTTYKSPCMYRFNGEFRNDSIFYHTTLFCKNIKTGKNDFRSAEIDTFLIRHLSKSRLSIIDVKTEVIREYLKISNCRDIQKIN